MSNATDAATLAVNVVFFASLRETMGLNNLEMSGVADTTELINALRVQLGDNKAQILAQENIKIAVNQEIIEAPQTLNDGDEVAFLPPVTGG